MEQPAPGPSPERLAGIALVGVAVTVAIALMHAGRDTTFWKDDWDFVTRMGWAPDTLLRPHYEHLSLFPLLVYKLLLETLGLAHYWAFRLVLLGLDLACGWLLFAYARPRIGPWPALAGAAALMVLGDAFPDILWGFQIGFLMSLACGLGALHLFDRQSLRGDALACLLLVVAVGSSSIGLPIAAGFVVDALLRPDRRRRLWVPLVPLALYAAWYTRYGVSTADLSELTDAPRKIWLGFAAGARAITGMPEAAGPLLAVLLLAAAARELARPGAHRGRLLALLAAPVVFWTMLAVSRQGLQPSSPRYLYPAALWVGLIAAEVGRRHVPRGGALLPVMLVLVLGIANNARTLEEGGNRLRAAAGSTRAALRAAELAGPGKVASGARIDPNEPRLRAEDYFRALAHYGSSPVHADDG